jgi:tetratricopeptide (TPR) repeat protein
MLNDKTRTGYGQQIYRNKRIRATLVVTFIIAATAVLIFVISRPVSGVKNDRRELVTIWNDGNFEQTYEISKAALAAKPIDNFLLTMNGFSAFQLGISQINNYNMLLYLNECIVSLRKAMLLKESAQDGRVCYVLGKAYSYKGDEYADLAIKYLEMAKDLSYNVLDIPEFLGIAYAVCGDYRSSVEAFSQAFVPDKQPSDTLLLSIARSYISLEEYAMAAGYLKRCVDISPDSKSILVARSMLAEICKVSGDHDGAEMHYISILNDLGEDAEVHYQLGELYSLKGDAVKARSEWRLAHRQDPAHVKARARLNI